MTPEAMNVRPVIVGRGRYDLETLPNVVDTDSRIAIIDGREVEVESDAVAPQPKQDPFEVAAAEAEENKGRPYATRLQDVLGGF